MLEKEEPVTYRWDTSGNTPRRVRVAISYGGGKVPESCRFDQIRVRGYQMPTSVYLQGVAKDHYPADVAYLCHHVKQLEREVERLQELNSRLEGMVNEADDENTELEAEVERLREALETIANAYKWPADSKLEQVVRAIGGTDVHRRLPTVVRIANAALAAREREKGND